MRLNLLDQIGDWNPQLFRELKGRLKSRNVLIAIGLSLMAQFLLLNFFNNQLPNLSRTYSKYCTEYDPASYGCLKQGGDYLIDWMMWWRDIFIALNWGIILVLMLAGVYLLINDLDQEERRGTLNFIRLSPQRSRSLLTGKLLGVPVLLYLAVGAIVPLHLFVGMQADVPTVFTASYYLMLFAGCYFLYSAALLGGFMGKLQGGIGGIQITTGTAFLGVFLTAFLFIPNYFLWNVLTVWSRFSQYVIGSTGTSSVQWFYIPLEQSLILSHGFTLFALGIGSYWIWQALDRCFHSPGATLLSKRQSYGLMISFQVLMLGFFIRDWGQYAYDDSGFFIAQVAVVSSANLVLFLVLIAMLSAHRQTLLDWARYRHFERSSLQIGSAQTTTGSTRQRSSMWQDLVWGEKSPPVVAIAINMLITAAILLPWIIFHPEGVEKWTVVLGLVISLNLIAIYASIAQLTLMMKNQRRGWYAMSAVALAIGLPLLAGVILYAEFGSGTATALLLFSPMHWVCLAQGAPAFMPLLAIVGQWGAIVLLNAQLAKNLKRVGASESKPLLAGVK
ncbi:ABC transporter permease [Cyanobacteria bacterium FACHB-471]|nr:ABC transporter permease [Cyanobacteria bacterium FACHB-471]